jgi:hypothetical protein
VSLALTFVDWYMPLIGLGIATILAFWSIGRLRSLEAAVPTLATSLRGAFVEGGSVQERQRLSTIVDRLAATFGLHEVTALIIVDEAYNATLLLEEEGLLLLVTSALVRDFELIEIEGVVAHLMARHRLGLLEREAAAALSGYPVADAHRLAGTSQAYRADEVAAAGIRYPLGLSQALSRCAEQRVPPGSFFASARYDETRWVWFNIYSDRTTSTDGDVDDAVVRARALAEW